MRQLFLWLGHTPVGLYMRDSTNGFAAVEAAHLLGLAALGGTVVLLGLAVLQVAVAGKTPGATARGLYPVFLASLTVMLATGVLLTSSKPLRYFLSPAFRVKIALLALGVGLYLYLSRRVSSPSAVTSSRGDQALAVLLLILWLGVGLAGRFIGLL
jgi:hypothetical protein